MGLFDFVKIDSLQDTLNKVSFSVLQRNSTSISTSVDQKNELNIVGNSNGSFSGNTVEQNSASNLDVSALLVSAQDGKLQTDLEASLLTTVKQQTPFSLSTNQLVNIQQRIKNIISNNITSENLQKIITSTSQSNVINVMANSNVGINLNSITQSLQTKQVVDLVSKMNQQIVSEVKAVTGQETTSTQSTFDFGSATIVVIIIAIILAVGIPVFVAPKLLTSPWFIGGALVVAGVGAYEYKSHVKKQ